MNAVVVCRGPRSGVGDRGAQKPSNLWRKKKMTMVPLDLDLRSTKGAQKKTRTFLGFGDMLIACHNVTWCQSGSLKENPRAAGQVMLKQQSMCQSG